MDIVEEFLMLGRRAIWLRIKWKLLNPYSFGSGIRLPKTCLEIGWGQCDYVDVNAGVDPPTVSKSIDAELWQFIFVLFNQELMICLDFIPLSIRKSLQDLLRLDRDHGTNGPRIFWRWLDRQPWRKMLPTPQEFFGMKRYRSILFFMNETFLKNPEWYPRVSVVMVDNSLPEPYFVTNTPMFFPSEMLLGQTYITCMNPSSYIASYVLVS